MSHKVCAEHKVVWNRFDINPSFSTAVAELLPSPVSKVG